MWLSSVASQLCTTPKRVLFLFSATRRLRRRLQRRRQRSGRSSMGTRRPLGILRFWGLTSLPSRRPQRLRLVCMTSPPTALCTTVAMRTSAHDRFRPRRRRNASPQCTAPLRILMHTPRRAAGGWRWVVTASNTAAPPLRALRLIYLRRWVTTLASGAHFCNSCAAAIGVSCTHVYTFLAAIK